MLRATESDCHVKRKTLDFRMSASRHIVSLQGFTSAPISQVNGQKRGPTSTSKTTQVQLEEARRGCREVDVPDLSPLVPGLWIGADRECTARLADSVAFTC